MNDLPGSLVGGGPLRIGEKILGGTPGDYLKVDENGKLTQGLVNLVGVFTYKGQLDASGGSYPSTPSQGDVWIVSVAGTISGTHYGVGDWAVYDGTSWDKIDNQPTPSLWTETSGVLSPTNDDDMNLDDGNLTTTGVGTFGEVDFTKPGLAKWTMQAAAITGFSAAQGMTFSNDLSDGYFALGAAGEVTFFGNQAFFGFADRTEPTDNDYTGGFYKENGVVNFWNNVLAQNTVSIADNGDVAIGITDYDTYSSDGSTSSIPAPFYVDKLMSLFHGRMIIDPSSTVTDDTTSVLQLGGDLNIQGGVLLIDGVDVLGDIAAALDTINGENI